MSRSWWSRDIQLLLSFWMLVPTAVLWRKSIILKFCPQNQNMNFYLCFWRQTWDRGSTWRKTWRPPWSLVRSGCPSSPPTSPLPTNITRLPSSGRRDPRNWTFAQQDHHFGSISCVAICSCLPHLQKYTNTDGCANFDLKKNRPVPRMMVDNCLGGHLGVHVPIDFNVCPSSNGLVTTLPDYWNIAKGTTDPRVEFILPK